jgi:hypothetical protein
MPYTAEHPPTPTSDQLRARIPGWGATSIPPTARRSRGSNTFRQPPVHTGTFRSGSRRSGHANGPSNTSF